jgi:hypothetical protein
MFLLVGKIPETEEKLKSIVCDNDQIFDAS